MPDLASAPVFAVSPLAVSPLAVSPLAVTLDRHLFGLPLPDLWFALVFLLLGTFLFLDGFDFGVGALFATREDEAEREQLLAAIGPFWDGNEVWLVVFGGALFAAFPAVYAGLFSRHYLLMFAILGALILRGVSPELYEQRDDERWHRLWGRTFVVGSVAAPFLVGVFAGNWVTGATATLTLPGLLTGLALVALVVADGAAFLGLKTRGDLRAETTRYGVRAAVAYVVLAVLSLGSFALADPTLGAALRTPAPLALVALTALLAAGFVGAVRTDRFYAGFLAVGGLVYGLVALLAVLLYPAVDPAADLTVAEAVVSPLALNLMTVMAALLLPLVASYFVILYATFGGPVEAGESY